MRSQTGRIGDLKYKLMVVELLEEAKRHYTFKTLGQVLGMGETQVSRYTQGHVLPTVERAVAIHGALAKLMPVDESIKSYLKQNNGAPDLVSMRANTLLMRRSAMDLVRTYKGARITKILTEGVDSAHVASMMSNILNVDLLFATGREELLGKTYYRKHYAFTDEVGPLSLYVPTDAMDKRDSILVVSLAVRNGLKEKGLIGLAYKSGSEVAGVAAVVGLGEEFLIPLQGVKKEFIYADSSNVKSIGLQGEVVPKIASQLIPGISAQEDFIKKMYDKNPDAMQAAFASFREKFPQGYTHREFEKAWKALNKPQSLDDLLGLNSSSQEN